MRQTLQLFIDQMFEKTGYRIEEGSESYKKAEQVSQLLEQGEHLLDLLEVTQKVQKVFAQMNDTLTKSTEPKWYALRDLEKLVEYQRDIEKIQIPDDYRTMREFKEYQYAFISELAELVPQLVKDDSKRRLRIKYNRNLDTFRARFGKALDGMIKEEGAHHDRIQATIDELCDICIVEARANGYLAS